MSETLKVKIRRERQPDGSVKLELRSISSKIRDCGECEWCKRTKSSCSEKDVIAVKTCHYSDPPKICGVEKLKGEFSNVFVPTIPEAKVHYSLDIDTEVWVWNDCKHYLPYGSHYNTDREWVFE